MNSLQRVISFWNWFKNQYPLFLLSAVYLYALYFFIQNIQHPVFPYQYDKISTFVVLGAHFAIMLYAVLAAGWYLTKPCAWRNTVKIWLQCTLLTIILDFLDLYFQVTAAAIMSDFIAVEIANSLIPFASAARGLYKIYTGQSFTVRQTAGYILALTLGANLGTICLFIWHTFFQQ
ncbi:MAG: hypothetical protein J6J74_01165 [Elusimicrobiaceae bacterium]|nr:hypothetical protein [Elusimicrobiaceae bacterium]